jgi:hypothetical protein
MRRIWLDDPAIRNFIGPADYAWDWNVPGGAPGYGPMRALDDLARLLDRAIGTPEPAKPDPEATQPASVAQKPPTVVAAQDGAPAPEMPALPAAGPPATSGLRRRGGKAAPV